MRGKIIRKCLSCVLSFIFCFTPLISPANAQYSFNNLPAAASVALSETFAPVLAKGVTVNLENPFQLDFIIHPGDVISTDEGFRAESMKLVKYFLAALTVPEDQLWVNLSPYEKDRIIPDGLGQTEMGRDLLSQDYILKQLTASLMNPENEEGKKFWEKIYSAAGTMDIPIETFNKVWIVPAEARIYEHKNSAFVVESKLKVMLEEDYFARDAFVGAGSKPAHLEGRVANPPLQNDVKSIIRQTIIPIIEEEVNTGKNFANLRQIYNSMLLAAWYKKRLKESVLGQAYADQNNVNGIKMEESAGAIHESPVQKIWEQYVETFKSGAADLIKEDYDPASGTIVARKYFAGGFAAAGVERAMLINDDGVEEFAQTLGDEASLAKVDLASMAEFSDFAVPTPGPWTNEMPDGFFPEEEADLEDFKGDDGGTRSGRFSTIAGEPSQKEPDAENSDDSAMLTMQEWNAAAGKGNVRKSPEFPVELGWRRDLHQFQAWFDGVDSYFVEIVIRSEESLGDEGLPGHSYPHYQDVGVEPYILQSLKVKGDRTGEFPNSGPYKDFWKFYDNLKNDAMLTPDEDASENPDRGVSILGPTAENPDGDVSILGPTAENPDGYPTSHPLDGDNSALLNEPGGIDLKQAAANMQIQMSEDGEFVFPAVDPAMLEQIRAQGLVPVIRDIRTLDVPAIRLLLGLADTEGGDGGTDYGSDSPALRPEEVGML